jgi:hypothetical protein
MSNTATIATPGLPQTTVEPSGGPFIRHSEPGKARIYDLTAQAFGGLISNPLVAIPGYAARFRTRFVASGGVNSSTANVFGQADAPYNAAQLMTLWDALGTTIYSLPGYEGNFLVPLYSGGFGLFDGTQAINNLPSFAGIAGGTQSTVVGSFTFNSCIPLEFAKGYGCLGMADGDVLPKLQVQLQASSSFYLTAPVPTLPTIEFRLNADFYWLPQGQDIAPPGLGSTRQWFLQQGNPSVASNATSTVTIPRQGGYLDTVIFILRDSLNIRIDGWPSIFRFALDGIGEISTNIDEIYDDMAIQMGIGPFQGTTATTNAGVASEVPRPVGTICITRKTSLGQRIFGLLDSLETVLSTSPGTAMTVEGAPWAAITNTPAQLNAILGQIIPSAALLQGLPEI